MAAAEEEGQGGLIALSVEEADLLIRALQRGAHSDMDLEAQYQLWARLKAWRARHVPAGATDGD